MGEIFIRDLNKPGTWKSLGTLFHDGVDFNPIDEDESVVVDKRTYLSLRDYSVTIPIKMPFYISYPAWLNMVFGVIKSEKCTERYHLPTTIIMPKRDLEIYLHAPVNALMQLKLLQDLGIFVNQWQYDTWLRFKSGDSSIFPQLGRKQ